MNVSTDLTIAKALRRHLASQLHARTSTRFFFRVSGFSQGVYAALLDLLAASDWRLGEIRLEVRSIEAISGYQGRLMEPGRSATWYRNHVSAGHALVLIQNRNSTDAQSLKDLYPVTELSLSRDGLHQLIEACFARYQLGSADQSVLTAFVRRIAHIHHEPQLRDLVEFLTAVDAALHERPGTMIERAIVLALPHLGLFRSLELEPYLGGNVSRGDRLIRLLKRAARIGSEVVDDRERNDYLARLSEASLNDDEALGGLGSETKRALLRQFIEGELRDNHPARLRVLQIDWSEIQQIILPKVRVTRGEKLARVADLVERVLAETGGEQIGEVAAEVVADLRAGREPDAETIDRLLMEHGEQMNGALRAELRRLMKLRPRKHSDFLVGVTALAVELLTPRQRDLLPGTHLEISVDLAAVSGKDHLEEALVAFNILYGGCEMAIPQVRWQLQPLRGFVSRQPERDSDEDVHEERERLVQVEVPFRVRVVSSSGAEQAKGELIWQYRSDSPTVATVLTLNAEHNQLLESTNATSVAVDEPRLRVPLFNRCPQSNGIGDLDISRPVQSFGTWFEQAGDLRSLLARYLQGRVRPEAQTVIFAALGRLEEAWGQFVATAATSGLLAADARPLLLAYEDLLRTAAANLRTPVEVAAGFRALNQAWIIGSQSFERWAVVPLVHPLKLLWWVERARYFNGVVARLLEPGRVVSIVDEPRYQRELAVTYGSSGFPPVLSLPVGDGRPVGRFLPVEESEGYELFFREAEESEPFGRDTDSLADDEADIAQQRAVEGIVAVVQDYIETYPFVRDGLEIVLFECRNGALPGMLVEQLTRAAQRYGWRMRLSVIVHTSDRGAPLFQRVSEWVAADQDVSDRRDGDYFPPVSLKVLQAPLDVLLATREDGDIVILADVLSERGQRIVSEITDDEEPDVPLDGFLPTAQALQEPFQQGDLYRRLRLSAAVQPAVARLFLLAQHAARERKAVEPHMSARFYRELTLDEWELTLGQLHEHFNWVICYDPTIDRFLLQSAFPDKVQVIRYSLGLGAKRQHNLTVSSSHKAQSIVERRLASRLSQLLPNARPDFLTQVAAQLVAEAKQISGDIVLRAAGPGAFLNELIGLVMAKFETERRYRSHTPDALTTWILLDDFEHWFGGGKFPDLLFVAVSVGADDELLLHLEVLEAKCVGQLSFAVEAADAELQVRRGVSRLVPAFAPGGAHLDALYWYDQLYRAVVGNLKVGLSHQSVWEVLRARLHRGAFRSLVEGHAWAFCYDGQAGVTDGPDEHDVTRLSEVTPLVPLRAHHYGRNELCAALRDLIEASSEKTPGEMWTQAGEPPSGATHAGSATLAGRRESIQGSSTSWPSGVGGGEAGRMTDGERPADQAPSSDHVERLLSVTAGGTPDSRTAVLDHQQQWLKDRARDLERALRRRGMQIQQIAPADADVGPSIVRFKLRLSGSESVKRLQAVAIDLARDLALTRTPFIDNVLGTNFVGVDIPREQPETVDLLPLLQGFPRCSPGELLTIIGKTPDGKLHIDDLSEFPHLLVAGATGSGKSVFLRSVLLGLMTQYPPSGVELLIVDPKQTDFSFFDGLPYLRGGKVFTRAEEARDALLDLVRNEMPRRQQLMKGRSFKIKEFNKRFPSEALPPIVALIDEYAQLLSIQSKKDAESFERDLMSLAAVARSTGIHLILATQRPSVNVVTGTLKTNLPTRIAFQVPTNNDSRVVLDTPGAENLLGRGDMLYRRPSGEVVRLQAPFLDEEQMQAYLAALAAGGERT